MDVARTMAMYGPRSQSASASISTSVSASASASAGTGTNTSIISDAGFGMVSVLRVLKIVERSSGLSLFTTQWKWHPHAHVEGVDALVQSLAQFAREIDGGDVMRVHFDSNTSRSNSVANGSGSTTSIGSVSNNGNGNGSSTGNITPTQSTKPAEGERRTSSVGDPNALEMLVQSSEHVQAVLFHDRVSEVATQRLRWFMEKVLDTFLQIYSAHVTRLQPAMAATRQTAPTPEQTAELMAPFVAFGDVLQNELLPIL